MGPSGTGNTSAEGPAVSGEKIEHGTSLVSDGEGPFFRGKDRLFKRQPQRVGDRGVAHKATAKWLSSQWFPARTVSTSDWKGVLQAFPKALRPAQSAVATVFPQVLADQAGIFQVLHGGIGVPPPHAVTDRLREGMGKLESLGRNPCRRVSGDDRRHCDRLSDHTEDETEQSRPPTSQQCFSKIPRILPSRASMLSQRANWTRARFRFCPS